MPTYTAISINVVQFPSLHFTRLDRKVVWVAVPSTTLFLKAVSHRSEFGKFMNKLFVSPCRMGFPRASIKLAVYYIPNFKGFFFSQNVGPNLG